jgi:hypothetical protein
MYSAENYLWGWVAYGVGVACLLFVLWFWMRKLRFTTIRHLFLLLVIVFLLTPVTAYRDDPHLAPAFFVSLYEGFLASGGNVGFQRGLAPILALSFFAFIFYGLIRLMISRFKRNRKENKKEDKKKDQRKKIKNKSI